MRLLTIDKPSIGPSPMDEACRLAHVKLLSGTCPWCGNTITKGEVLDSIVDLSNHLSFIKLLPSPKFESYLKHKPDAPSLREVVLSRGPLLPKTAVKFAVSVVTELETQFSDGAHKNISLETIFIDLFENVLLGPPAFAFDDEVDDVFDNSVRLLGIADCLAPEQALNSHKVDQRTDIYSLGCSLFYMLTCRAPFQGTSVSEVLMKHQIEAPTSAHKINPNVPETLAIICQKMMAKKQEDRYQNMTDLRIALRAWLEK